DADGHLGSHRGAGDLANLVVELPDVARVHAHRGAARVDRGKDVPGLEVDVGDDRDLRLAGDGGKRVRVVLGRHGDPHDLAARRGQLRDLLEGRVDVGGQRGGHRLYGDRRAAAHRYGADHDLPGVPARGQWRGRNRGHAEIDCCHVRVTYRGC